MNEERGKCGWRIEHGQGLPPGWTRLSLAEVCEINPRRPAGILRKDDEPTTFVPMQAIDERHGTIRQADIRPYGEVRSGYTYFEAGDVLFAKITPCMQNGKHAVARDLIDDVGFGSTEFHVLRPRSDVMAEWVHYFLRQPTVLSEATVFFTGTVGQRRVGTDFFSSAKIPLPPLPVQKRLVSVLNEQLAALQRARAAAEAQLEAAAALPAALLRGGFDGTRVRNWPRTRLGNLLKLRNEVVHPRDNPAGVATFVGLEHIESTTGRRIGAVIVEKSTLKGRKPQFFEGDVVYGYLRPYLNKVWVAEFDGLCSVDQYVFVANSEDISAEYVAWFMRSPIFLKRAPIEFTPGQLPRIRTEEVLSVEMELPPLGHQKMVAQGINVQFQSVDKARGSIQDQLRSLDRLESSVLRGAFSGRI
jgi:type I restriction enzyme, S subunit